MVWHASNNVQVKFSGCQRKSPKLVGPYPCANSKRVEVSSHLDFTIFWIGPFTLFLISIWISVFFFSWIIDDHSLRKEGVSFYKGKQNRNKTAYRFLKYTSCLFYRGMHIYLLKVVVKVTCRCTEIEMKLIGNRCINFFMNCVSLF